jgi:hypothetical protein
VAAVDSVWHLGFDLLDYYSLDSSRRNVHNRLFKVVLRIECRSYIQVVTTLVTTVTTLVGIVTTTATPVSHDRIRLKPVTVPQKSKKSLLFSQPPFKILRLEWINPR